MSAQLQSSSPPFPAWEKQHLWYSLLLLGFDPEAAAAAARKIPTHLHLGINMFNKPNRDAFHVVAYFLFTKLDCSRCKAAFRFCFPPSDKKTDSEFRKQCCEWLRSISSLEVCRRFLPHHRTSVHLDSLDECGSKFPLVVASLFVSPGGPKFIHLMLYFARYVLMLHIKAISAASGMNYIEVMFSSSPDLNMALARYHMAQNRFLRNVQKEDLMIQALQKKAQLSTKRIRDLRYESAELDKQLQKLEKNAAQVKTNLPEKVEKVRHMWTSIMETLNSLRNERAVVDSVVEGHVDQYTLDGTDAAVNVPRILLEKVEKDMHKVHVGNVYEAGKLNFLTVIQLLNSSLAILKNERQHVDKNELQLDRSFFEKKAKFLHENLLGLQSLRHKLEREDHVSINQSIAEKQREWDLKWESFLGQSPFHLIKDRNPALDLLPAMSPLSFAPASEEAYKSSIFCQYPASIPDSTKRYSEIDTFKRNSEALKSESEVIPQRIALSSPPDAAEFEDGILKPSQQVASVVVSGGPQNPGGKGNELEDTIGTLVSDPFLTRKQIPRTPENLMSEIRNSWKEAIQTEESSSVQLLHTEMMEDKAQHPTPALRNQINSSLACFMSFCVPTTAVSPLHELQSPLYFQELAATPCEPPVQQAAFESLDKTYCSEELTCVADDPKLVLKTINEPDHCPEEGITMESLCQNSSRDTTLLWKASQVVEEVNSDRFVDILEETLLEGGASISLNSSSGLEADDVTEGQCSRDSKSLSGSVVGKEYKVDFQALRDRYEALKKSLLENKNSLPFK